MRAQQVEESRHAVANLLSEFDGRGRRDRDLRLDTLGAVRTRLGELAEAATKECWSFSPGGAHRPDAMAASKPLNQLVLERGVELRCVYQDAYRNDPETTAYAQWLSSMGGKVRTVPVVPMQIVLVDREVAIVPVNPAEPRMGALEVRTGGLVAALCALFEQVWRVATPMGAETPSSAGGLTPADQEILQLLAAGHTDDAVSRKLGISVRTVRRSIAELHDRLSAASRFQAGVNSVRRGWL
jgi:DNA-binding CsgD family transcriptional regulator